MPKLSPAAQAAYNAYSSHWTADPYEVSPEALAAALRAVAEEVAPLGYEDVWTDGRILQYEKNDPVREKLLAIADELEAQ